MDRKSFASWGLIVVAIIVLAIMIAFATPFGRFISNEVTSTLISFKGTTSAALSGDDNSENNGVASYTVELITDIPGAGTVEFTGDGHSGTRLRLQGEQILAFVATCNTSYQFLGWYVGDTLISEDAVFTTGYAVNGNVTIEARFIRTYTDLTVTADNRTKVGYEGTAGENLVILETFQDVDGTWYKVIAIGSEAFADCSNLTSVTVPDSVESIDDSAFDGCSGLESIAFNGTVVQWNAVAKDTGWHGDASASYVQCSNGKVCIGSCAGGAATCQQLAICTICGNEYGEFGDHAGGAATCEQLAKCSVCDTEYGEFADHIPNTDDDDCTTDITCSVCGGVTTEGNNSHNGGAATCQQLAICTICGTEYGELSGHRGGTATCQQLAVCTVCGTGYGELATHSGGTANCIKKAICSTCGNEYGELGSHQLVSGSCTICGPTTIETAHNPYKNGQNYVGIGTWDYSLAKSVNITITYQTEPSSLDLVALTKGTDYANGSHNKRRDYLTTSGEIITDTPWNTDVRFQGSSLTTVTFENVDMLTGTVVFNTDSSNNYYYGATVVITPNY